MSEEAKESGRRQWPVPWKVGTSVNLASPPDLQQLSSSGLEGVELAWRPKTLDLFDPAVKARCGQLVKAIREGGLAVWSFHIPYGTQWDPSTLDPDARKQVLARFRNLFPTIQEWGIGTAIVHPSWEPIPAEERGARLEACRTSLRELAGEAARYGIRLAVECLPRTCLGHTAAEIEALISADPALGICCDVNHLVRESPESFIRRLGSRIITTHMSDNDGADEKHWLPGTGVIRWNEVIGALVGAGYRHAFLYEAVGVAPDQLMENYRQLIRDYEWSQSDAHEE